MVFFINTTCGLPEIDAVVFQNTPGNEIKHKNLELGGARLLFSVNTVTVDS